MESTPWSLAPLSALFTHIDDRSTAGDERLLSITKERGVIPRDLITDRPPRADTLIGYKRCRKGDVVVNQMSAFEGLLGISDWDGIVTYHYLVFRPRSLSCDARFFTYLLRTDLYTNDFARRVRGLGSAAQGNVRTPHIRIGDWLKTVVPVPPLNEQRAIADYLDREVARIDALVTHKRRMIELLGERRTVLLLDAVAPAGFDWDIESGYRSASGRGQVVSSEETPLKHLVRINPETLGEDTPPDREFRYIEISTTGRGRLVGEPARMTFAESPSRARRVLAPGDTILSTVRTYLKAVWTLTSDQTDLVGSTGFACLRPTSRIDAAFLGWLAQSDVVIEEVVARSVGVSYPAINASAIGTIRVALLSLPRQRAVAEYLDRETAGIDALVTALEDQIALLNERRQALITAVVTGQLQIPEAA